ncbi:MAG: 50S ribosomal protein L25/general stress protein Ctc [Gammaproteobacteria bacterium]
MAIEFTLNAEARGDAGRGASRRLRREGRVPAILYGGDSKAEALTLDHNELIHNLKVEAFHSHVLTLKLGKKSEQVILKDVQHHPFKNEVVHIDLLRIKAGEKLDVTIPLHFVGADKSPGVKEGGVFSRNVVEVEIQCLPQDIPEYLEIDVSMLDIGDVKHLSDIVLPEGVEILALAHDEEHEHDVTIAAVHHPRVTEEEEPEGEAAEAAAEAEGEEAEGEAKADEEGDSDKADSAD